MLPPKLLDWTTQKKRVTESFERKREMKYPIAKFGIRDIEVVSNVNGYARIHELTREKSLKFLAPKGWTTLEEA